MNFDNNSVIYHLPEKITSSIESFEELFEFRTRVLKSKEKNITISFEKVSYFEPSLCTILGAILEDFEHNNKQLSYDESLLKLAELDSVFIRNSFIPRFFDKEYKDYLTDKESEIPYKKFNTDESNKYDKFIREEILNKPNFPSHSKKLGEKIKENIFELFENAKTHGKCDFIHTCGHFKDNYLSVAIVDLGTSIINNVKEHLNNTNITPSICIDWAMQRGNTTKKGDIPGGLGLNIIFEFIELNKGRVQILSSNGYWEFKQGKKQMIDLKHKFKGTIVILDFNLTDPNSYILKSEEQESKNIF